MFSIKTSKLRYHSKVCSIPLKSFESHHGKFNLIPFYRITLIKIIHVPSFFFTVLEIKIPWQSVESLGMIVRNSLLNIHGDYVLTRGPLRIITSIVTAYSVLDWLFDSYWTFFRRSMKATRCVFENKIKLTFFHVNTTQSQSKWDHGIPGVICKSEGKRGRWGKVGNYLTIQIWSLKRLKPFQVTFDLECFV